MTSSGGAGETRTALPPPAELEGLEVRDAAGAPVGRVEDVYVDREHGGSRYLALATDAPGHYLLVLVEEVRLAEGEGGRHLRIPHERERVRAGPTVARDAAVTRTYEEGLHAHYGRRGYWERPARPAHGAGYMRPDEEPPEVEGAGYMRPETEPPEVEGAGYMRPETEPPEVRGAGYMRPEDELGEEELRRRSAVRRWRH